MWVIGEREKYLLDLLWRRKWWLILPLVLAAGASVYVVRQLPESYYAETTILVIPQSLPADIARATATTRLEDRLASFTVQIRSRSNLELVARNVGLIPPGADELTVQRICSKLERSVFVQYDRRHLSYFKIGVRHPKARVAAELANGLAESFIEQNQNMGLQQADRNLQQAERWLQEVKTRLDHVREQIAEYERAHVWELPERKQDNVQQLQAAQQQLDLINQEIRFKVQRLDALRAAAQGSETAMPVPGGVGAEASKTLAQLQEELNKLLLVYTDEHPEVRRKRAEIREFMALQSGQADEAAETGQPAVPASLLAEIAKQEQELAQLTSRRELELEKIARFEQRIDRTPIHEQKLGELKREEAFLAQQYQNRLEEKQKAERAAELERTRQSEQYRIQDPALVPSKPERTMTLYAIALCLAAGLAIGAGAIFVAEVLDTSVRSEEEFRRLFPEVPILASVPNLDRPSVKKKRRGAAAVLGVVCSVAGVALRRWAGGPL